MSAQQHFLTHSDYERAISLDELYKAAIDCIHGIKWKQSVASWILNIGPNIVKLHDDLKSGKYKLQPYQKFQLSAPKPRIISATRFRDRVVQRSLCRNGLYKALTHSFIYDNLACQTGKGLNMTLERVKHHLHRFWIENHTNHGWYLKLDIAHYFQSTPHLLLKTLVRRKIIQPDFCRMLDMIIDSFEDPRTADAISADRFGARGIGLGSQHSQLLQLLYLDDFDHWLKEIQHIKHYIRYMDDMLIVINSHSQALDLFQKIQSYLSDIGLQLNPKSHIGRIDQTMTFLKTNFTLKSSGHLKIKAYSHTISNQLRRLKVLTKKLHQGKISAKAFNQNVQSWHGFAMWKADGRQIKAVMDKIVSELIAEFKSSHDLQQSSS